MAITSKWLGIQVSPSKSLGSGEGLLRITCSFHYWHTSCGCVKWLRAGDMYRCERREIPHASALQQQVVRLLAHCGGKWSLHGPWLTEAAFGLWDNILFKVLTWVKSLEGISPSKSVWDFKRNSSTSEAGDLSKPKSPDLFSSLLYLLFFFRLGLAFNVSIKLTDFP